MLNTISDGSFSNSEGKDLLPLLLEILFDLFLEHHHSSYSEAPYVHLRPECNAVYTREKTEKNREEERERERERRREWRQGERNDGLKYRRPP